MATETRTTTGVQTETAITIKNEQAPLVHVVDKSESNREDLYETLCECKWAIVTIVFIVCVLFWLRPELVGLIVFLIVMINR